MRMVESTVITYIPIFWKPLKTSDMTEYEKDLLIGRLVICDQWGNTVRAAPILLQKSEGSDQQNKLRFARASRFFVTLLHENFLFLIFMEDVKKEPIFCFSIFSWTWVLYSKFRKIHLHFSKFSYEMVLMAMKFETARIHFFKATLLRWWRRYGNVIEKEKNNSARTVCITLFG